MSDASRWRTATISLAFILLAVLISWVMREQAIRIDRYREREQWEADRRLMLQSREEMSWELERLDLTIDELRRERHHAATRATTRPSR